MTQEEEDNERLKEVKEGKREKDVFREAKRQIKRQPDTSEAAYSSFGRRTERRTHRRQKMCPGKTIHEPNGTRRRDVTV